MGMFRSAQRFISSTFDQATNLVEAVGQGVSVVTTSVNNRAKSHKISDRQIVLDGLTETLAPIRDKLERDEGYATLYRQLESEFDKA